ncbi:hypothetical protein ACFLWI_08755 [Chloroflexota bacterium]
MNRDVYEVISPLGRLVEPVKALAPRLSSLEGKTICELKNHDLGAVVTFDLIEEALSRRYPGVKFVSYTEFGNIHDHLHEAEVIKALPTKLKEYRCDAVISGNGM